MPDVTSEDATARQALYAAVAVVQGKLELVKADETAKVTSDKGSYSYKYADLGGIATMVYPILAANGLAFVAGPTLTEQGRFVLRWRLLHSGGAELTGDYPLPAESRTPQALGSAITYGRRYCLAAVVGVVVSDDDGAAAEYADRHQQQQQTMPPVDNDRAEALTRVQNAWATQYGAWDPVAAGKAFADWSGGEDARTAPHGRLRSFAAYLATLAPEDAGSDPAETAVPPSTDKPTVRDPDGKMTKLQQGHLFAGMADLGLTERQDQLQWIMSVLGRELKSRSEITKGDAVLLIDTLRGGVDVPVRSEPAT